MNDRYLVDGINLALPNPILEISDKSDIVDEITRILGRPKIVDKENSLTEIVFEAEDSHDLRLLRNSLGTIISFSVTKQKQSVPPSCPKKWMDNIPQVIGVGRPISYTGFPIFSVGWVLAYARSRDDASATLAANVAAALPTLCPDTCPPHCQCIPKKWTREVITSSHRVRKKWGIPVGGNWQSTAIQSIRAYCK